MPPNMSVPSTRLVIGHDEAVARLVDALIPFGRGRGFGDCAAIGVDRDGELVGGFVLHDWSPEAGVIEISFAGIDRRWLSRPVLYGVFSYVFDQLGCQMACSRTPAVCTAALRIARAYGFRQIRVPRLFGRNEDGIISTLVAEDWRSNGFHKENCYGQESAETTQSL